MTATVTATSVGDHCSGWAVEVVVACAEYLVEAVDGVALEAEP